MCDILLFSLQVFLSLLLFNAGCNQLSGFRDSLMGLTHSSKTPDMETRRYTLLILSKENVLEKTRWTDTNCCLHGTMRPPVLSQNDETVRLERFCLCENCRNRLLGETLFLPLVPEVARAPHSSPGTHQPQSLEAAASGWFLWLFLCACWFVSCACVGANLWPECMWTSL